MQRTVKPPLTLASAEFKLSKVNAVEVVVPIEADELPRVVTEQTGAAENTPALMFNV
jgi:hypothetical protein